jgi:hypothetical protein
MLITFKTKAYANITMFGDVGLNFLDMMEFGKAVPGAISAGDVAQALQNLEHRLGQLPQQFQAAGAEEADEATTSMHTRAVPLLELLSAAVADETAVRWD